MSCGEMERLFVAGAPDSRTREHAAACPACAVAARDHEEIGRLVSGLRGAAWRPSLREALLAVPTQSLSCAQADGLLARLLEAENEIAPADRQRLDFHRSRCEACGEAAQTLLALRELVAPHPGPWFTGRVASTTPARAARQRPARGGWRLLLDPKAAIGLAYAAAVALMILGFNPADLARKARTDLPVEAKTVVADARTTLADRAGSIGEKIARAILVVRSRALGYGRAALSNAVSLVLKSEPTPGPGRPRNDNEKGAAPKNETAITTWRA